MQAHKSRSVSSFLRRGRPTAGEATYIYIERERERETERYAYNITAVGISIVLVLVLVLMIVLVIILVLEFRDVVFEDMGLDIDSLSTLNN